MGITTQTCVPIKNIYSNEKHYNMEKALYTFVQKRITFKIFVLLFKL